MSIPTPGEVRRRDNAGAVIPSEGPCGDVPLDDALAVLNKSAASFEADEADAALVIEAAQSLHERIQTRLAEAR